MGLHEKVWFFFSLKRPVNEFLEEFHSTLEETEPFWTFFDVVLTVGTIGYVVLLSRTKGGGVIEKKREK